MKYQKPQVVAKSAPQRSFVAGCPTHDSSKSGSTGPSGHKCVSSCEIAR